MQQADRLSSDTRRSKRKSLRAFDRVNMTAGDVRDVFEPYLAIFLTIDQKWNPAQVGLAVSATSIASILTQAPIGGFVDRFRHKQLLIAVPSLVIAISYLLIVHFSILPVVLVAQALVGISVVVTTPATAAISLGLVGYDKLDQRVGRNETFNRAGNLLTAMAAGILGQFAGRVWIFYILIVLSLINALLIFGVRRRDIDLNLARGGNTEQEDQEPARLRDLLRDRTLLIFCSVVLFFYLANAALLPLVSQVLSGGQQNTPSAFISGCIVVSQLTTMPVAAWTGNNADRWGRKPLLLLAFAALILRASLYGFNQNPWFILIVQSLDGISSGIFAVLTIVILADIIKGSGRFNLAQGTINTLVGMGSALSNIAAGFLVKAAGFSAGFWALAIVAGVGLVWLWRSMPETKDFTQN
jgi:MFS family permease